MTEEQAFDEKIETPGGNFYVDGGSLKLTHYCTMGNRPVLTSASPSEHEMSFECTADECCGPEMHMHAATITIVDDDHVTSRWSSSEGEGEHEAVFNLVRRAEAGAAR